VSVRLAPAIAEAMTLFSTPLVMTRSKFSTEFKERLHLSREFGEN